MALASLRFLTQNNLGDDARRTALFGGDLLVHAPTPESLELIHHAREMIKEALGDDPENAQHRLKVEEFAHAIGPMKSKFTNHDITAKKVIALVESFGADLAKTYFDVPRLRVVTSGGYLTAGLGYAYKAHRDTWYSSPKCQINWWIPIYDIDPGRCMSFFPNWWSKPLENSSEEFDYAEWLSVGRQQAAAMIGQDTRKHPLPLQELGRDEELRTGLPAGAVLLFSAAHLHATAPNDTGLTRFSLDFRTVQMDDLIQKNGPMEVDNRSRGTTLGDFHNTLDGSKLPENILKEWEKN